MGDTFCDDSGKIQYPTRRVASGALRSMRKKKGGRTLEVFQCRMCGLWHIGNHHNGRRRWSR